MASVPCPAVRWLNSEHSSSSLCRSFLVVDLSDGSDSPEQDSLQEKRGGGTSARQKERNASLWRSGGCGNGERAFFFPSSSSFVVTGGNLQINLERTSIPRKALLVRPAYGPFAHDPDQGLTGSTEGASLYHSTLRVPFLCRTCTPHEAHPPHDIWGHALHDTWDPFIKFCI